MNKCICRFCGKIYEEQKSRADYKGYCSQKCLHAKAKFLGYKKNNLGKSEYYYLRLTKNIGSVFVESVI